MFKRLVSLSAAAALLAALAAPAVVAGSGKDETVYVNLGNDGSVEKINVVNGFGAADEIIDYGAYTALVNLTDSAKSSVSGEMIKWHPLDASKAFYYQGSMDSATPLPWDISIKYYLDGAEKTAEELAGSSGQVEISISVGPSGSGPSYFADNLSIQVSVPLDTAVFSSVDAPGAAAVVAGGVRTLNYTVLPGSSRTFVIRARADGFKLSGISFNAFLYDMSSLVDSQDLDGGIEGLASGMDALISGTETLGSGLDAMNGALKGLKDGAEAISKGSEDLEEGQNALLTGYTSLEQALAQASSGSNSLAGGLSSLAQRSSELATGVGQTAAGIDSILAQKEQLSALAQSLVHSDDPAAAQLAQAVLAQLSALSQLKTGVDSLKDGFSEYAAGVKTLADSCGALDGALQRIYSSIKEINWQFSRLNMSASTYFESVKELGGGISQLYGQTSGMGEAAEALVEGEKQIAGGISEAKSLFSSLLGGSSDQQPVSFAAPGRAVPNSVQFIMKTAGVEAKTEKTPTDDGTVRKTTFWEKLLSLFGL